VARDRRACTRENQRDISLSRRALQRRDALPWRFTSPSTHGIPARKYVMRRRASPAAVAAPAKTRSLQTKQQVNRWTCYKYNIHVSIVGTSGLYFSKKRTIVPRFRA